jgi:SET domain-containing protein
MTRAPDSYFSPKLEVRPIPEKGGQGVFARQPIRAGEIITIWGGRIISGDQFDEVPPELRHSIVQIEENFYTLTAGELEPVDYTNHSCNANAGLSGQITLVAMRPIEAGEEVCFDYAMTDGSPYDEFDCNCGAPNCRGRVTGDDWQRPELWERYAGYFSPYLQRRIDRLKQAQGEETTGGR